MENKKPQSTSIPRPTVTQPKTAGQPSVAKQQAPAPKAPTVKTPMPKAPGARVTQIPKPVAPSPKATPAAAPKQSAKAMEEQLKAVEQQVISPQKSGVILQPWQLALAVVLVLALITGAVYLGTVIAKQNAEDPIVDYTGGLNNGESADPSGITLPGYSALTFAANSKKVALELPNPTGNPCYFRYTLTIVETGEEIYVSELIEPAKALQTITLNQPLTAGTYTLRIEIDTFSLTDGTTPMNGGVQEVKLIVK